MASPTLPEFEHYTARLERNPDFQRYAQVLRGEIQSLTDSLMASTLDGADRAVIAARRGEIRGLRRALSRLEQEKRVAAIREEETPTDE